VELSFIAHSMGAYVVTNVVRILTDAFDPASIGPDVNTPIPVSCDREGKRPRSSNIGNVFIIKVLVLVSTDLHAEALTTSMANFLSDSLPSL
jgi:esterase/lipase superfamily enzyme